VAEQQRGGQPVADQRLHALDEQRRPLQDKPGPAPFGEQNLVLAPQRALGAVGAHRHQPQERIEVEAAQPPGVGANPEVPFQQQGLEDEGQSQGGEDRQDGEGRQRGIQPDETGRRQQQLERGV
jgi:hypothetical protein